jgi:hypothetical protein
MRSRLITRALAVVRFPSLTLHRLISLIAVLGITVISAITPLRLGYGQMSGDAFGYYTYLPAFFIEHDLTFKTLLEHHHPPENMLGLVRYPQTSIYLNKFPPGVAVLSLPFFGAAHALSLLQGTTPTGYEPIYLWAVAIGGLCYMLAGLAILGHVLKRYVSEQVVLATLICIVFGTNLFHYATRDAGMSHAFSFFLITSLLAITPWWCARPTAARSALVGLIAGLIVITRNPNIVFLSIFPLYGLVSRKALCERLRCYCTHLPQLAVIVAIGVVALTPQLAYWHFATGHWLVYAYQGEGFNFGSPKLAEVLFSTQKGLYFYAPLLLFAVTGLWSLRHVAPAYLPAVAAPLLCMTYMIASWHDWQYGASYGHRAFTDSMGLFAIGLAAFLASVPPAFRRLVGITCSICMIVSVVQMLQYWLGILPPQDTTWEIYRSIFLRF